MAVLRGSLAAGRQNRDLSVQAGVPVRVVEHQRAERLRNRLLSSVAGCTLARFMVHQYGIGRSRLVHARANGAGSGGRARRLRRQMVLLFGPQEEAAEAGAM